MTDKKLNKLLGIWAARLRLVDWDIAIKQVPHVEGTVGEPYGGTNCKSNFMEANIQIRLGLSDAETELTLVHELLHIVFGGLVPPEGLFEHMFEVGIEKTARTLIEAYGKDS